MKCLDFNHFVCRLMPCPLIAYLGPKMFCASPNFSSQPENLTAFSASSKTFMPVQKTILLNANHLFVGTGTKYLCLRYM